MLMLVAQRDPSTEDPGEQDLHAVGTAALVVRMLRLPDGRVRILVQGLARAAVDYLAHTEPYLAARLQRMPEPAAPEDMETPGAGAHRQGPARRGGRPRPLDLERGHGGRHQPPGPPPPRRPRRLQPRAQARGRAGAARDGGRPGAAAARLRAAPARDPPAPDAAAALLRGAPGDGPLAARVLPAPAAARDPCRAGRERRPRRRDRRLSRPGRRAPACRRRPARSSSARCAVSSAPIPTAPRAP